MAGAAGEITIVVSGDRAPYQEALQAFYRGCSEGNLFLGLKSVSADSLAEFRLVDGSSAGILRRSIVKQSPRVLVAVGGRAMRALEDVRDVPIVYLLVPAPEDYIDARTNLTGVSMRLDPERQLDVFFATMPSVKRLGLIFDPDRTGKTVERIARYCSAHGIALIARQASDARQVPTILSGMRGMIDAFWMLPDPTVITPQTLESIFSFSLASQVPVVAFSKEFLEFGAAISVGVDERAAGKQASELVLRIMASPVGALLPKPVTGRLRPRVNFRVTSKLGLEIETSLDRPPLRSDSPAEEN